MTNDYLIRSIAQKINKTLKNEGLKPQTPPGLFIKKTKGKQHRYHSICETRDRKMLVFYARLHKNIDTKKKMRREIAFALQLQKKSFREKIDFYPLLPDYYKARRERTFEWFEREFFQQSPIGKNERLDKNLSRKEIKDIAQFLSLLSKTNLSYLQQIPLEKSPVPDYQGINNFLKEVDQRKIISQEELLSAEKFLKQTLPLLKKENKYFSHGDVNLGNVFFIKNKLKIIDWESMQINNFAYDIAYLFCHLWQAKKWQRKYLIESYLNFLPKNKLQSFKILFRINLLYLAEGGLWAKPAEIKKSQLPQRKIFFVNLIKATLKDFNKILTV